MVACENVVTIETQKVLKLPKERDFQTKALK